MQVLQGTSSSCDVIPDRAQQDERQQRLRCDFRRDDDWLNSGHRLRRFQHLDDVGQHQRRRKAQIGGADTHSLHQHRIRLSEEPRRGD